MKAAGLRKKKFKYLSPRVVEHLSGGMLRDEMLLFPISVVGSWSFHVRQHESIGAALRLSAGLVLGPGGRGGQEAVRTFVPAPRS